MRSVGDESAVCVNPLVPFVRPKNILRKSSDFLELQTFMQTIVFQRVWDKNILPGCPYNFTQMTGYGTVLIGLMDTAV